MSERAVVQKGDCISRRKSKLNRSSIEGEEPFCPQEWRASYFSLQYHRWIKHEGHKNKRNDHQRKMLLIVRQILLISTSGKVCRTVWRKCILMWGCKGLHTTPESHKTMIINHVLSKHMHFFYSDDQGSPSLCKKADFYIGIWNLDFGVRANFANNFTLWHGPIKDLSRNVFGDELSIRTVLRLITLLLIVYTTL